MNIMTLLNALGGLALFLLAMQMMTEGLKVFAGDGLKQLLSRYTSTPFKGVLTGILVTGIVQSSGAVTVAVIGFVNAGLMGLRQALGVVFGSNIGTTTTGWLQRKAAQAGGSPRRSPTCPGRPHGSSAA